jgi:hypothetical protein
LPALATGAAFKVKIILQLLSGMMIRIPGKDFQRFTNKNCLP